MNRIRRRRDGVLRLRRDGRADASAAVGLPTGAFELCVNQLRLRHAEQKQTYLPRLVSGEPGACDERAERGSDVVV